MTAADARDLAWNIGGSIAAVLVLVGVILVGLAVLHEVRS